MKNEKRKLKIKRSLMSQIFVFKFSSKAFLVSFLLLFFSACSQLETPKSEPFYAETAPPQKKEFRWSNGKMPKSFDPAFADVPPASDIVRAIYEGLTDIDPKTLQPIPAIAENWKSSDDLMIWTFNLRKDARWSNGERVTATDFVRSWKRLVEMKEKLSHPELLQNIVGLKVLHKEVFANIADDKSDVLQKSSATPNLPFLPNQSNSNSANQSIQPPETNTNGNQKTTEGNLVEPPFGVEAVDDFTLKISLVKPDKDFPALVAHPIFRPIYGDGKDFETNKLNAGIVTNGAFRIFSVGQDGITLDRAENYWNLQSVELERVRFVPTDNAEQALAAYRAGEIDAVTNIDFEPLALKLLTPFDDFQRTPHAALNYYEFNLNLPPFNDRRAREALAISIERERLTEDEMDGASKPALKFLPFGDEKLKLVQDTNRAKNLLTELGFPNGENFPVVKLLVNRNNVQQRIARSVAKMWKQNLNVETEIVVKEADELKTAWASKDYALIRRGAVLPTTDETVNMMTIFAAEDETTSDINSDANEKTSEIFLTNGNSNIADSVIPPPISKNDSATKAMSDEKTDAETSADIEVISSEQTAIEKLPAIPLYFSTSYSLVKPYIQGFDINVFDAPLLKNVKIDNNWQPKSSKSES